MSMVCTDLQALSAGLVGEPAIARILKDKPGRRRTSLVQGPRGTAVVKAYASNRAPVVARRISALAAGPSEPAVPRVLALDEARRLVVLSPVPGRPLTEAVIDGELEVIERAGAALGKWHAAWWDRVPAAFSPHPVQHERAILAKKVQGAASSTAAAVAQEIAGLEMPWPCRTVVHRDLYETQMVVGDRVGMIDLDDAACGPPELDIGNLLAHLTLLGGRLGRGMGNERRAFLRGYLTSGPEVDAGRLQQCETLSRLRLACIHNEPALVGRAASASSNK